MRVLERPYPSFALVITQAQYSPIVAADHRSYTHTYARSSSSRSEAPLMMTVDYHYDDPMFFPTLSWPEIALETDDSVEAVNLQAALDNRIQADGTAATLRRSRMRFSTLVVDLALTIKRKCQRASIGSSRATAVLPSTPDIQA
ncbi:hypothetical protein JAAARDRAFT_54796 [Jaapia argillacea MUCL 33604]|uniref:Uncharacterized protein n=1 Tax=Jaapia argillacea MUCL 33604 TaxID=933084 RepID=A0A067Q5N2_9AGAM|nr:hypothetical protein JAAARDRAFT_54796 [Jaapia argillacea MUCL 33604]